jgi:hypothetical protein
MKLFRLVACVAFLLTLMFATSALAAPPNKQAREFNFETDEVTVDVLKPDAQLIEVLRAKARKSLIRIRMDFIKEIVRSAEDI